MENKLLEAVNENWGVDYANLEEALVIFSHREVFDEWLKYEGIVGYTSPILRALNTLGLLNIDKAGATL